MFVDLSGEYDFLHFFSLRYNLDSLQKTTVAKISEHCFYVVIGSQYPYHMRNLPCL